MRSILHPVHYYVKARKPVVSDPRLPIRTDKAEFERQANERAAERYQRRLARKRRCITRGVKRFYRGRQRAGLCRDCGQPRERWKWRCDACQERERQRRHMKQGSPAVRGHWATLVEQFLAGLP
jgi:hypothetical protein